MKQRVMMPIGCPNLKFLLTTPLFLKKREDRIGGLIQWSIDILTLKKRGPQSFEKCNASIVMSQHALLPVWLEQSRKHLRDQSFMTNPFASVVGIAWPHAHFQFQHTIIPAQSAPSWSNVRCAIKRFQQGGSRRVLKLVQRMAIPSERGRN